MNNPASSSSSRRRLWKLYAYAFSHGLPGAMCSTCTPAFASQRRIAWRGRRGVITHTAAVEPAAIVGNSDYNALLSGSTDTAVALRERILRYDACDHVIKVSRAPAEESAGQTLIAAVSFNLIVHNWLRGGREWKAFAAMPFELAQNPVWASFPADFVPPLALSSSRSNVPFFGVGAVADDGALIIYTTGRSGRFSENLPRVSAGESAASKLLILAALTDTPPIPPILLTVFSLPTLIFSNSKSNTLAEPATA